MSVPILCQPLPYDLIAREKIRQHNHAIGRIISADFTDGTTLSHAPSKLPASSRTNLQPAHNCQIPRKKWTILKTHFIALRQLWPQVILGYGSGIQIWDSQLRSVQHAQDFLGFAKEIKSKQKSAVSWTAFGKIQDNKNHRLCLNMKKHSPMLTLYCVISSQNCKLTNYPYGPHDASIYLVHRGEKLMLTRSNQGLWEYVWRRHFNIIIIP